jgi:hypothetical protein
MDNLIQMDKTSTIFTKKWKLNCQQITNTHDPIEKNIMRNKLHYIPITLPITTYYTIYYTAYYTTYYNLHNLLQFTQPITIYTTYYVIYY